MSKKYYVSTQEVADRGRAVALLLQRANYSAPKLYGVPRGGIPALLSVLSYFAPNTATIVEDPAEADAFIDDVIDSGETMRELCDKYPGRPFLALIDKTDIMEPLRDEWVVFPWEGNGERSEDDTIVGTIRNRIQAAGAKFAANHNIARFIKDGELDTLQAEVATRFQHVLDGLIIDTENDHNTQGTAARVAKMYLREVLAGRYTSSPSVTVFPNVTKYGAMYITGPITVRSMCSHHFAPIIGKCWVGIKAGSDVTGLSKFNRIVEWIARRPQIQEEMVVAIADYIHDRLQAEGVVVAVEAEHLCMTWRGVNEHGGSRMFTPTHRGTVTEQEYTDFLRYIHKG